MFRSMCYRLVLLVTVVGAASACDNNDPTTPTQPTTPPVTQTETFSGRLNQNGAITFPFVVASAGGVTATMTAIAPDSTKVIGMAIGTWNGTACTLLITNDQATQGSIISGNASAAGNLCIRVYDVGYVTDPITFSVQVVHP